MLKSNIKIGNFKYYCLKDKNQYVEISIYIFFIDRDTMQIENNSFYVLSFINKKEFVPNVFNYFNGMFSILSNFFKSLARNEYPNYIRFHMTNFMNINKRQKHISIYKNIIFPKIIKENNLNYIYYNTILENNLDFVIFRKENKKI